MKTCTKCGQLKSPEEFHRYPWKDGRRPDCKACRSAYSKARQERIGSTHFTARRHGTSASEYRDILAIQNGVCAICGTAPRSRPLAIDHDHETDRLRGLLCARCNGALGMMKDDPALLRRAAFYLEFWRKGWDACQAIAWQETYR